MDREASRTSLIGSSLVPRSEITRLAVIEAGAGLGTRLRHTARERTINAPLNAQLRLRGDEVLLTLNTYTCTKTVTIIHMQKTVFFTCYMLLSRPMVFI